MDLDVSLTSLLESFAKWWTALLGTLAVSIGGAGWLANVGDLSSPWKFVAGGAFAVSASSALWMAMGLRFVLIPLPTYEELTTDEINAALAAGVQIDQLDTWDRAAARRSDATATREAACRHAQAARVGSAIGRATRRYRIGVPLAVVTCVAGLGLAVGGPRPVSHRCSENEYSVAELNDGSLTWMARRMCPVGSGERVRLVLPGDGSTKGVPDLVDIMAGDLSCVPDSTMSAAREAAAVVVDSAVTAQLVV